MADRGAGSALGADDGNSPLPRGYGSLANPLPPLPKPTPLPGRRPLPSPLRRRRPPDPDILPRRYAETEEETETEEEVATPRPLVPVPREDPEPAEEDSNGYGPPAVRPASELVAEPAPAPVEPAKPAKPLKPVALDAGGIEADGKAPRKLRFLRPRQKVQVVRGVKSRRLVRRVDVWTVIKVSLMFYALAVLSLLVAGVILWNLATAFGAIHSIEKSVKTLFDLKTFTLHPEAVLGYAAGAGAVVCFMGVMFNVIAALLYNLISDVVGGIQVVVVSEPD